MRVRSFSLRFDCDHGFDDAELLEFCAQNEVIDARHDFFTCDGWPWVFVFVAYRAGADNRAVPRRATAFAAGSPNRPGKGREPHPADALHPSDRSVYDRIAAWRTNRAMGDGVNRFVVLTNAQIIAIARARPSTKQALAAVDGLGEGRLKRYGDEILDVLSRCAAVASGGSAESEEGGPAGGLAQAEESGAASEGSAEGTSDGG